MNSMEVITLVTILGSALVLLCARDSEESETIPRAPRVPAEFATGEWEEVP